MINPTTSVTSIDALRSRIDELDAQIIMTWRERAELSAQIGQARLAEGGTRLSLSREQNIIDQFHRELGSSGTRLALLLLEAGRGEL